MKPGYKQTEVGVIPEEWEVVRSDEIGRFRGGNGFPLSRQGTRSGTYPFFKVSDMNNDGNETVMSQANHYISEETRRELGATPFPERSIVFAKVGAAIFLERKKILGQPSCIDNNLTAYVLDENRADVRFIHTVLLTKKLGALVSTTALPSLNGKQLGEIKFLLPPLPEQRAIAAALSDVDALLAALDRLLAKKRDLKQAAMQQLLTGQTRLPGFTGEWVVKRLDQTCQLITKGTTPTSIGRNFTESGITFLKAESLSESGETIPEKVAFIDGETHKMLKRSQLKAGDLLISIAGVLGRVGRVAEHNLPANTNQALAIVRPGAELEIAQDFLFYSLRSPLIAKQISNVTVQAAQANISLQNVRDLEIHLPISLPEQTAIAAVLSDMDAELAALEQRREKTRALKQGMMQELLTGKTRLV